MKYNNQIITKKNIWVCLKKPKKYNNLVLRQAWTGGRPVSSILTDRTEFEMLKAYRSNVCLDITQERNFENIDMYKKKDDQSVTNCLVVEEVADMYCFYLKEKKTAKEKLNY